MNCIQKSLGIIAVTAGALPVFAQQPVDYVNPIIGTNGMGRTGI